MNTDSDNSRSSTTFRTYAENAPDYLVRHRDRSRIEPYLRHFTGLLPAGPVLDLGCGPGFDGDLLRKWGHQVIGLDRTKQALHLGVEHCPGPYVCADMRALPFRGRLFSGVWALASLLHLSCQEMSAVLQHLSHILLPEGVLHMSVQEGSGGGWDYTYGQNHPRWFTFWSADALDAVVTDAGFEVTERSSSGGPMTTWLRRLAVCRA